MADVAVFVVAVVAVVDHNISETVIFGLLTQKLRTRNKRQRLPVLEYQ